METIQEYLKKLDTEKLIEQYLYDYPIEYELNPDFRDMTVRSIQTKANRRLHAYIDHLRELPVVQSDDGRQHILYVTKKIDEGLSVNDYCMGILDEMEKDGVNAPSYAYEFMPQSEIMSFLVADTPLTQRNIYGLAANVMHEASFFGFEQEFLAEEKKKLEESMEQMERGEYIPWEELKGQMQEKYDIDFEARSEDEIALKRKVFEAMNEYAKYSRTKEIRAILERIHDGK